jgi:hypothetical protein
MKFEHVCLGGVTLCAMVLLWEVAMFARDARRDQDSLFRNVNTLLVTANQTVTEARDASTQAKLAAIEQRAYWQKTSLETYKTMASLRLAIVRTNGSVNDVLVPRLGAALDSTQNLSVTAAQQLEKTSTALQPILADLTHAAAGASTAMNDPAIHESLAHVDDASAHAALAAAQTEQIAGHLNDASRDFAAYIHRITAPARGVYSFFREMLGLARDARQAGGI